MSKKVEELLRDARSVEMTAEEREAQRISFVYGNTAFENERITRELVDRVADKMKQTDKK